ncbi:MAG: pantoate--beta-alanine ligase [Candidatus Aadella gelida]|nr:pantoate--beta-alanine ligase [Candidatus Aadella gelida]
MKTIETIKEMRDASQEAKKEKRTIGLVPTMGYLHEGHMSLVRAAREECDEVVVSIFVNPAQFGSGEDLGTYPRDIERDKKLLEKENVDILFLPQEEEMYPEGFDTFVENKGPASKILCGARRPGHFRGVTTVVAKLFNIIRPDKSYFGQKDAQQAFLVRQMVKDLDLSVDVRIMPIVREEDGLAMSSRNVYLSQEERTQALNIFRSLKSAKELASSGEKETKNLKSSIKEILEEQKDIRIDYVEILDTEKFEPINKVEKKALVAVAVFVGKTRLIDNMLIGTT